MESFGIFNFLQSLLSVNPSSPPESAPKAEEHSPNSAETPTYTEPTPPTESVMTPNAFLDFAQRHDERAKRTRQK